MLFPIVGVIMLIVALLMFGPIGIVAWALAMGVTYWYGKKQGWW